MGSAPKHNAVFVNLFGTVNFFHLRFAYVNMVTEKQKCRNIFNSFFYLFIYSFITWFFKSVGFHHSHGQFAAGGNEKKKRVVIFFFISMPKWQIFRANETTSWKTWRVFSAAKKWMVRGAGVSGFISSQMGTFVAKNWKEISVDATNVLLCYDLFRKERDKYKVSLMNRSYLISQKRSP